MSFESSGGEFFWKHESPSLIYIESEPQDTTERNKYNTRECG